MTVPVILIHRGNHGHYKKVINQARIYNEKVYAIGDCVPPSNCYIADYYQGAEEFNSVYEHLNTNSRPAELICFQRWFILRDFMDTHGIQACLHIDSDVMLYAVAHHEFQKFSQFDFTLSHRCCGSNSFFTLHGLKRFCDFLMYFYHDKSSYEYERITAHFHIRQKHGLPGGVCDMTLLEYYSYQNCGKIGEMMHIIDDSTYDHNINARDQYFRMGEKTKDIVFVSGFPYCYQETTGKQIQFKTLHFQGPAKGLIHHMNHFKGYHGD